MAYEPNSLKTCILDNNYKLVSLKIYGAKNWLLTKNQLPLHRFFQHNVSLI